MHHLIDNHVLPVPLLRSALESPRLLAVSTIELYGSYRLRLEMITRTGNLSHVSILDPDGPGDLLFTTEHKAQAFLSRHGLTDAVRTRLMQDSELSHSHWQPSHEPRMACGLGRHGALSQVTGLQDDEFGQCIKRVERNVCTRCAILYRFHRPG